MRLKRLRRRRGGVIDRRGEPGPGGLGGFPSGGGGFPIPTGAGIPVVLVVLILLVLGALQLFGGDEGFGDIGGGFDRLDEQVSPNPGAPAVDPEARLVKFVDAVVDDVQVTWEEEFARSGLTYEPTSVVLFSGSTRSGCGSASASTGPFYCPADRLVYLDLDFFRELERRFGAPGDFAEAYVIAHEVGHHVQTLLGTNAEVQRASRADPDRANELSIRLELQADCLAGVWAHSTGRRDILERGDVEEGIAAASAVGDDRIQKQATGATNPETWTHGSSRQRVAWFQRGLGNGQLADCDTFGTEIAADR